MSPDEAHAVQTLLCWLFTASYPDGQGVPENREAYASAAWLAEKSFAVTTPHGICRTAVNGEWGRLLTELAEGDGTVPRKTYADEKG